MPGENEFQISVKCSRVENVKFDKITKLNFRILNQRPITENVILQNKVKRLP